MTAFELLSSNMKKKIWDMKWDRFTPIQEMTIPLIINTNKDVIVSSGTASGKTEAALLPILSLVENEARETLKVIYISPLKALINNQFDRIEKLCEYSDIAIHRWHGDVSQSKKNAFLKNPTGILQITPESIESLFVNRTNQLKNVFQNLEFIVIDEIHSFFDNERGVHLRSLISRLTRYTDNPPRMIGLSATVDNFDFVKTWVNIKDPDHVEIVDVKGSKQLLFFLMHVPSERSKIPLELFEDLRDLTRHKKAIIFCNNRGQVEEATVMLNRLAEKEGMGETYYPHHSSIDKKEREYVEKVMSETSYPKSVIATSSLELGIDIGNIEVVVQIDSTYSVSSLKQRLGRSGRKQDAEQMLQLYSTNENNLLQSLAVMELVIEKWVEPSQGYRLPYDVLFHQIISICQEYNGISKNLLLEMIHHNSIFYHLPMNDVEALVQHMIEKEYLEVVGNELIVGLEGERLLRSKEFYAVFMTPEEFDVIADNKTIGQLDRTFMVNIGDNIILAGRLWTIRDIDYDRNKIYVMKAVSGKKPMYSGNPGPIHKRIGEKMMEILCSSKEFHYIDQEALKTIQDMRKNYHFNSITPNQRVIWVDHDQALFETFTGTKITNTLVWMLRSLGVSVKKKDDSGRLVITGDINKISRIFKVMKEKTWQVEELLPHIYENELIKTKYSEFINEELRIKMHVANEVDIEGAMEYLTGFDFWFV